MVRRLTIAWMFNTVALFVAAWLLAGLSYGNDWWALFAAGLVFMLVSKILKPVLAMLSIPFIVLTFGVFYFLINVFMLYVTHWVVPEFDIQSFGWAALAAIIISAVNGILQLLFRGPGKPGTQTPRL